MKIASWNCNNLEGRRDNNENIKTNRIDYLNLLREKVPDLDVIFLMEVESDFYETALDHDFSFHFFLPCVELDPGWQVTSGIFLAVAKHIRVLKHEVLLPGKGIESAYGLALRTVLKDSRNQKELDLVSFWNLQRTCSKPNPYYEEILDFLLRKLTDAGVFNSGIPHLIIGDFNRTPDVVRKLIPDTETVLVTEETFFKKKNPDENGSSLDHIICRKADSDSIRFLGKDGQPVNSFKESLGFTERHTFVKKEPEKISDHLPLFVQF